MRGVPQGHDERALIMCHNCNTYHLRNDCEERELHGYNLKDQQFESRFNNRIYWLDDTHHSVTMWQCPGCKDWMRDPNDDDPETPLTYHVVPWKCGECGDLFPDKHEADQCCS